MPDKPKRRKNNKNKRKNKTNKNIVNKVNDDVSETVSVHSSDCQEEIVDDGCEINQADNEIKNNITDNFKISENTTPNIAVDSQRSKCNCESEPKLDDNLSQSKVIDVSDSEIKEISDERHVYVVEPPDLKKKNKSKLNNGMKSKSVDNDESPSIVEITEELTIPSESDKSVTIIENTNIVITDDEPDIEWEKMDELHEIIKPEDLSAEAFSVTTIPLEIAQCKETKCLSPEEEKNLRCYLQGLNLATSPSNINSLEIRTEIEQIINREIKHRLRKKGFAEDVLFQRGNISRGLDVIDEEGSSESSATSRRHSYLSDKKSDNDELEDEVFENKATVAFKPTTFNNIKSRLVIPQQCILVDAKLREPEVTEARGNWSLKTVEKIAGAEVVYLTDSSSSTSSLYDVGDDTENDEVSDASIRIITPTIEVTDTENFLTNTFISKDKVKSNNGESQTNDVKEVINKVNDIASHSNNDQELHPVVSSIQHPHEIVVLSTEDIKTNLFVKDVHIMETDAESSGENESNKEELKSDATLTKNITSETSNKDVDLYDLEIKVLKCELNDAINNLIKEVSDSESTHENTKDIYTRQDSSSSVCSSQCTAKYNPNYSSLNDVSNIMHEDNTATSIKNNQEGLQTNDLTSHVKEVFQCVAGEPTQNKSIHNNKIKDPPALKDLCVKRIASFPFGNKILEELAYVSERLQNMSILALQKKDSSELFKEKIVEKLNCDNKAKMPYFPLPDLSTIHQVSLTTKVQENEPPPVQPRNSSLKKSQDDQHWTAIPTTSEPLYVCLSPSQKMLMEKTNTVIKKEDASQLIDTHKKFVDRRGYNENLKDNVDNTPIVPFKSATGSRLLALIRDPSVTSNLNFSSNFNSLDSLPKLNYFDSKGVEEKKEIKKENIEKKYKFPNLTTHQKSFKPIPPPRPRKFSSSFYESDESSDFTDNSFRSMQSEKKLFHYSTGNLNKEIENDISSIQNMHRHYSKIRNEYNDQNSPRRPSLPKDLCDQQMEYIRRKEKEVEQEIRRLEREKIEQPERKGPRAPLIPEKPRMEKLLYDSNISITRKNDNLFSDPKTRQGDKGKLSSVFSKSQEELVREKMYSEYVNQMAEREQRRQHKFIKITYTPTSTAANNISKSMPTLEALDSKVNNRIEKEFISKARERWHKLGIEDPETEDEKDLSPDIYREPKVIEHKIKVIQAGEERDLNYLPNHLREFVTFTAKTKEKEDGRTGESEPDKEPTHVVVFCAVIILVFAVGRFFLRLLQNKY